MRFRKDISKLVFQGIFGIVYMERGLSEMANKVHYDNEDMNKAAYYMSSEGGRDWQKGAEYADKACGMGEKQPYIASIYCHKEIAEELMEQGELVQSSSEWKTVFDRVISVRDDLNKEVYQLKDFEQKFIDMAQDDSLYGMALVMYIGLLERDETQDKEFIVKNMVAGLECVDTPKAKLLLGLGYDMQNKRKQAAKLLRNVIETTDYAEQEKESYEELAYFHGVVCLAFYYRDGIPNYIEINSRQAVVTLENGINSVTNENLKQALMEQRQKHAINANAEQSSMATVDRCAVHDKDEFVMGNGVVYSRNRMKKSVDMCVEQIGLKKIISEAKNSLRIQYPTDEEYIKNNSSSAWEYTKIFVAGMFITSFIFGVLAMIARAILRYKVTAGTIVIDWIVILAGGAIAVYLMGTSKTQVIESNEYKSMKEERDWRDSHINEINNLITNSEKDYLNLNRL